MHHGFLLLKCRLMLRHLFVIAKFCIEKQMMVTHHRCTKSAFHLLFVIDFLVFLRWHSFCIFYLFLHWLRPEFFIFPHRQSAVLSSPSNAEHFSPFFLRWCWLDSVSLSFPPLASGRNFPHVPLFNLLTLRFPNWVCLHRAAVHLIAFLCSSLLVRQLAQWSGSVSSVRCLLFILFHLPTVLF